MPDLNERAAERVAVIGMSGRFPRAADVEQLWANVRDGVDCVSSFSDEELLREGVDPALLQEPAYVRRKAVLENVDGFDAALFQFSAREAEITDPQQRLFLECAWEALESAGYDPDRFAGWIGVYAGADSLESYFLNNLYPNARLREFVGDYQLFLSNDKEFLPTRVSYKLNLKGPSVNVQTGCSTSLVSVSMACESLLGGQCDMALAGGVAVSFPVKKGYLYQKGMILSPDGRCRAFDAEASGTVDGSGVGVLLLKRLDRALEDGDRILAVLSGWAVNNDGSAKVGFTAPSIEGQAEVIATAMAAAGADPSSIGYIEAHGTGTRVGDPIEMSALKRVFEPRGLRKGSCAIGSIKTNIGHLGAAAGIAGLIKAIQAVRYGTLPPSLHFETPNPLLGLEDSPFYVNTSLKPWKADKGPRRAGVSSFGIGGTNAHVIVEEPPAQDDAAPGSRPGRAFEVLALSAKTPSALDAMTTRLVEHLAAHPEFDLADVGYTLQTGRRVFAHRRALVVPHGKDGSAALDPAGFRTGEAAPAERPVVFMLPGQGAQHVGMARDLYESEPVVRHAIDACAEILAPKLGLDLRRLLYPRDGEAEEAALRLRNTSMAQPALFAVEYALARLWTSWGVSPRYLIGHSLGEYVAACLAEVLSLEDALEVVAARGRLMASLPPGAMLAVPLPEQEARALLGDRLSLAVINGPSLCVLSGDLGAVETLERELSGRGLEYTRLQTSHAFHSKMMDPILGPFAEVMRRVTLRPPTTRYISNVTGTWISDAEATDPSYWVRHLRETVRFSDGLARLLDEPEPIFLEVGPGRALTGALKLQPASAKTAASLAVATLGAPRDPQPDTAHLMNALAQLWIAGTPVDWAALHTGAPRNRVPLPTYPFERRRYFIDPPAAGRGLARAEERAARTPWGALVNACRAQAARSHGEVENAEARARQEALDRLCVGYIGLSLTRLGAFADPARECSEEEVLEGARVLPQYHQLVRGWLRILADAGHLTRAGEAGDRFLPAVMPTEASVARLAREAAALWAQTPHVFQGVRSSGEGIADVLSGRRSPQELSFDGGSFDAEQKVIEEMALVRYCNAILCEGIRAVLASMPADAGLRILEVGAGMGITSSWVLPLLPASRTSYTYTDVGRLFLAKAQERFAAFPFVRYGLLNLERPPSEQGYERHGHDVVIASNVLHVTRSTAETLRGVHELLAPGGLLLMWEITEHQLEFEVTSGFLMNPVEDGTRSQGNPFLTKEQWFALLRECGFVEMAAFPERPVLGHQILVAQRARSAEPSATLAFTSPAGPPREAAAPRAAQAAHPRPALRSAYLAPRDEVERRIAAIWQDLLGVDRVGVHDDYFELGGDSLLSVRLVGALRESLGVEIPARRLLDARTVAALAALAQERSPTAAPHPSLVTLEAGGSGRPLFLVHPVGGNVLCYAQLARRLGSDRPIHGLQAAGLDGKEPPRARIEEMASRHIEAMRRVDPSGPYLLGGWSYGGIVAYEMAAQLERQGASVSLLALLDSGAPIHSFTMPELDDAALLAWFARDLGACEDGDIDTLLAALRRLDPADQIRHVLDRTQSAGDLRPLVEVFKTHLRALHRYESPACSAPILLLRCPEIFHWFRTGALGSSEAADPRDPALGWRKVGTGAVEVCTIPGDHYSLLTDPHVGPVAEILKSRLARIG